MRLIDADAMKKDIELQTQILRFMFKDDENGLRCTDLMYEGYMAQIDRMPTIEPEQQWILCSDRLPKKGENVFVYLFGDSPYIAWHNGIDWYTEDFTVDKDDEPIAWMPLPESYRGNKDDE